MDKIGSKSPALTGSETRPGEANRPAAAPARTPTPARTPAPADNASVSSAPATDREVLARQAAARAQGNAPAPTRLVAGAEQFRGATPAPTPSPASAAASAINRGDAPASSGVNPAEQTAKAGNIIASNIDNAAELADGRAGAVASRVTEATGAGTGRVGSRLPAAGSGAGVLGGAAALPGQIGAIFDGEGDRNQVAGEVSQATGTTAALAKDTIEGSQNLLRGSARRAAAEAARLRLPNAPESVIRAASREAAEGALPESARRDPGLARDAASRSQRQAAVARDAARRAANPTNSTVRAATRASTQAARAGGSTLASTLGTTNRAAATTLLRQGGREASEAATRAVARRAIVGTVARAGGRFVPGLNVAIAAADTATAISTLRDPNASRGRQVTSVITAIGSVAAATNIPIVSQVGGAVSAVSSFVGAFF